MKKIITLMAVVVTLFSFGCKKDKEVAKDNQTTTQVETPKTDMEPFKKSLSVLKNPQYDLVYKLIENGGINAMLKEDVTIAYPSHAKRLIIDEPQITIQKGATPLGIAALFCTPSLVNDLIEKGADLKAKTNGMEVSALIIQCGEAEQAGMFENYLKAARKFEQSNEAIYKNKPELYAANAIIKDNITDKDGLGKTILNYAIENNLQDAIKVIIKYAGGINFTNTLDDNNNQMPVITALETKNFEALKFFFTKTASLYANMKAEDGTNTNVFNYIFYNDMGHLFTEANIEQDVLLNLILNGYNQKGAGIPEIRELMKNSGTAGIMATTSEDMKLATKNGDVLIPAGSNIAHIAAYLGYNYIIKGLTFLPNGRSTFAVDNSLDGTPLHISVQNGSPLTTKTLLEAGSDLANIRNTDGYTPLNMLAHMEKVDNQEAIAKILMTSSALGNYAQLQENDVIESAFQGTNKAVVKIIEKYNKPERPVYSTKAREYFSLIVDGSKIVRMLNGGVDNQFPFAINVQGINIPKDATPLIAAALLCDKEAIEALTLAMADDGIRITGENDLKYNAYDFADRMANGGEGCSDDILTLLKAPQNIQAQKEYVDEFKNRQEHINVNGRLYLTDGDTTQNNEIDDTAVAEEMPADNKSEEPDADVELVIE